MRDAKCLEKFKINYTVCGMNGNMIFMIVFEILPNILSCMKLYPHHGTTNCYQHCVHVAYYNYQWCRFFHLDARSAARGAMLHDLFLYDWHTHAKKTGDHFHGLTHPKTALKNASKFFELNEIEKDIIYNHMWPVTFFRIPKTKEGFITTLTDKYCGACETSKRR